MKILYLTLILFQLILLLKGESIEFVGLSALYNPNIVKVDTKFINLYELPYEYNINLVDLDIYNEQILNLTWVNTEENDPKLVSKVNSIKFKYGIKLLTSAFLKRYIDTHKSSGSDIDNLNIYIKNLNDGTEIQFYNEHFESNKSDETKTSYPEQIYNVIMRNKLGLFLRYIIPDRNDLKIGGITYSDLKYFIGEVCDSFAYEDYKLNNVGLSGNEKIVNYLFLSPIGTSFDIENDVERYLNYSNRNQLPVGIEHLISLALNNKIILSHKDIINGIINTSTNTIFNYLMAEKDTVNYNIRNTDSFKNAFQFGSRYIESQASFISIGCSMANYPELLYTDYQEKKWELAKIIKKKSVEETFLYDIKEVLVNEGKDIKDFLPFGIYLENVPFSIYKNTYSKKESYYYLFNSIERSNISVSGLNNIVFLFSNLLTEFDIYDNAYHDEKTVDTEYFINHLKQIYNKFYKYYDNEYKKLINSIKYKNNIKYIMNKEELLKNDLIKDYYNIEENKFDIDRLIKDNEINLDTDVDMNGENDENDIDDTVGDNDEDDDEYQVTLGYDINDNLVSLPYSQLNNLYLYDRILYDSLGNVKTIDNENILSFLDNSSENYTLADEIYTSEEDIEDEYRIPYYYNYNGNIYNEEQLLQEINMIKYIESVINENSVKISDGLIYNYLDILNNDIKKLQNYKYTRVDDYYTILGYLVNILKNKRLSILNGYNQAYNFEELFNVYTTVYDMTLNKLDEMGSVNNAENSNLLQYNIDTNLFGELYSSSNNNTLDLNDVLSVSNARDLIINYGNQYDHYLYNFIPMFIENYRFIKNTSISSILSELEGKIDDIGIDKVLNALENEIQKSDGDNIDFRNDILSKYETIINSYVSYVEIYNKISSIYLEQKKKVLSNGMIYNSELSKYLELFYKYYQALIYSDILVSFGLQTDCTTSYLGIPYYGCTSYKTENDDIEIRLINMINANNNVNTFIINKMKYWLNKYIESIKPMYRTNEMLEYAIQVLGENKIKQESLDPIENALISFYKMIANDYANYSNLNLKNFKTLSRYYVVLHKRLFNKSLSNDDVILINKHLNYIGHLITLNLNKDIINVQEETLSGSTEKDQLMNYINILLPLYNHLKTSYFTTFNLDNIIDIINSF